MSDKRQADIAEKLTNKAEKGESVSDIMNQIPFGERLDLAKKMDAINANNREKNPSLPDLQIETGNDMSGREHLKDIKAVTAGTFYNSKADVYDLPKAAQSTLQDFVIDSTLERDSVDTKHLLPLKNNDNIDKAFEGAGERTPDR